GVASMEPRSFKRGNVSSRSNNTANTRASMEPRSFKRGNNQRRTAARRGARASMEPRSFKSGNTLEKRKTRDEEAAHQWRHVHSNVESVRCHRGDSRRKLRFNGATFIQTWKRRRIAGGRRETVRASMEPRSFKRGNPATPAMVGF